MTPLRGAVLGCPRRPARRSARRMPRGPPCAPRRRPRCSTPWGCAGSGSETSSACRPGGRGLGPRLVRPGGSARLPSSVARAVLFVAVAVLSSAMPWLLAVVTRAEPGVAGAASLSPVARLRWHLARQRDAASSCRRPPRGRRGPRPTRCSRVASVESSRAVLARRAGRASPRGRRPVGGSLVGTAGRRSGTGSGAHGCPSCTSGSPRWAGRCSTTSGPPADTRHPVASGAESWIRFAVPRTADAPPPVVSLNRIASTRLPTADGAHDLDHHRSGPIGPASGAGWRHAQGPPAP